MTAQFANYPSLEGATVFVTGGASGIGAEIVRAFAAQKARIGFVDLDTDTGEALAAKLGAGGAQVAFETCDLRDIGALQKAFAALGERLGPAFRMGDEYR